MKKKVIEDEMNVKEHKINQLKVIFYILLYLSTLFLKVISILNFKKQPPKAMMSTNIMKI